MDKVKFRVTEQTDRKEEMKRERKGVKRRVPEVKWERKREKKSLLNNFLEQY